MSTSNYCPNLSNYNCGTCERDVLGRVVAAALVKKDQQVVDPLSPQEWINLICSKLAVVIPEIKGERTSTNNFGDGYGIADKVYINTNHEATLMSKFRCSNTAFWNDVVLNPETFDLYLFQRQVVWLAGSTVTFGVTVDITTDLNSIVEFKIAGSWQTQAPIDPNWCGDMPKMMESCKALSNAQDCYACVQITPNLC